MRMFRRGYRLLAAASIVLLLEAAAHTVGTLSPLPDEPAIQELARMMRETTSPLGLGMEPSAWDVQRGLARTMTVLLALMGIMGLALPAAAPDDRRVYRRTAGLLCVANLALLALWWSLRIPPPLLFQLVAAPLLVLAWWKGGPRGATRGKFFDLSA